MSAVWGSFSLTGLSSLAGRLGLDINDSLTGRESGAGGDVGVRVSKLPVPYRFKKQGGLMEYPTRPGSKVSAPGLLEQAARLCDSHNGKYYGFSLRELVVNLKDMADRFYKGDPSGVDEFLQLYTLDTARNLNEDAARGLSRRS